MRKRITFFLSVLAISAVLAAPLGLAIASPASAAPPPPSTTPPLPPPSISGTVADAVTGAYFSAPNVWLALYQVASGRWWIAGTDCSVGQGCAGPTGDFNFAGSFPAGRYEVEVQVAYGRHLVLRHAFEYDGVAANLGVLLVEPRPVLVEILAVSPEFPSVGGVLEVAYAVCKNPAAAGGTVPYRVRTTLIATPSGGYYADLGIGNHRGVASNRVPVVKFRDTAAVSASPPDGSWICVRLLVTEANDPFALLDENAVCVLKGFESVPWLEPRCSFPTPPPTPGGPQG